jgi:GNAT superfamily N-acetyltransferase
MLRAVLVEVTTWHLEMLDPSELIAPEAPASVELRQARRPTPELGRFLYTATGGNWYWFDRLPWTYDQWLDRLSNPHVETWVMYVDGTPAGYFELDGSIDGDVEIAYFGVMPAFIGRKLGGWLLGEAIRRGWAMGARRVWVHTCSLDAPQARANYEARGMRLFKEVTAPMEVPDVTPGPWPGAAVRGPHTVISREKENVQG